MKSQASSNARQVGMNRKTFDFIIDHLDNSKRIQEVVKSILARKPLERKQVEAQVDRLLSSCSKIDSDNESKAGEKRFVEMLLSMQKQFQQQGQDEPAKIKRFLSVYYLKRGMILKKSKDHQRSSQFYKKSIEQQVSYDAHTELGACLLNLKKYKESIKELREALAISPAAAKTHWLLSVALTATNQPEKALQMQQKYIQMKPKDIKKLVIHSGLLSKLKKPEKYLACFKKAILLKPIDATGEEELIKNGINLQLQEQMLAEIANLLKINQKEESLHCIQGHLYLKLKRFDEALKSYQTALKIVETEEIIRKLIEVFNQINEKSNKGEILDLYFKIRQIKQSDPQILMEIAHQFYKIGYHAQALQLYEQALELQPDNEQIKLVIGQLEFQVGNTTKAEKIFNDSCALNPESVEPIISLCRIYLELKQYQIAETCLNKGIKLAPSNSDILYMLGEANFHLQREDKAEEYLNKCLQMNPFHLLAVIRLADIQIINFEYKQAIQTYNRILKVVPSLKTLLYYQNFCYFQLGEKEKAIKSMKEEVQGGTENVMAYTILGHILLASQNIIEAKEYYTRACQLDQNFYQNIFVLGKIHLILKEYKQSKALLQKAISKNDSQACYYSSLGLCYHKMEQKEQAFKYYLKSLQIKAEEDDVYYNLGVLFQDKKYQLSYKLVESYIFREERTPQSNFRSALFFKGLNMPDQFLFHFSEALELLKNRVYDSAAEGKRTIHRFMNQAVATIRYRIVRFYPNKIDENIILGILYRDLNRTSEVQIWFNKIMNNYSNKTDSNLFEKFTTIYQKYLHQHTQKADYFCFLTEFLLQQIFARDSWYGMKCFNFLFQSSSRKALDQNILNLVAQSRLNSLQKINFIVRTINSIPKQKIVRRIKWQEIKSANPEDQNQSEYYELIDESLGYHETDQVRNMIQTYLVEFVLLQQRKERQSLNIFMPKLFLRGQWRKQMTKDSLFYSIFSQINKQLSEAERNQSQTLRQVKQSLRRDSHSAQSLKIKCKELSTLCLSDYFKFQKSNYLRNQLKKYLINQMFEYMQQQRSLMEIFKKLLKNININSNLLGIPETLRKLFSEKSKIKLAQTTSTLKTTNNADVRIDSSFISSEINEQQLALEKKILKREMKKQALQSPFQMLKDHHTAPEAKSMILIRNSEKDFKRATLFEKELIRNRGSFLSSKKHSELGSSFFQSQTSIIEEKVSQSCLLFDDEEDGDNEE